MGCREIMGAGAGEEGILSGCSGLIPTELRLEQPATARGEWGRRRVTAAAALRPAGSRRQCWWWRRPRPGSPRPPPRPPPVSHRSRSHPSQFCFVSPSPSSSVPGGVVWATEIPVTSVGAGPFQDMHVFCLEGVVGFVWWARIEKSKSVSF
jgi:hypothetical protein